MPHNGNTTYPVRSLTVNNFSVIKEAKLALGKITVLIGPQASGKSLPCKLAYFLSGEVPGIAVESLLDRNSWDDFLQAVEREFRERFVTTGWLKTNTKATYSSEQYKVEIRGIGDSVNADIAFSFSDEFKDLYQLIRNNPAKQLPTADQSRSELRQDLFAEISLLQDRKRTRSSTYIPSGRALFTQASKSIVALQNPSIDPITRRFAGLIAWDSRWKTGYLTTGRNILEEAQREMLRIAQGTVVGLDGEPHFLSPDGSNLPFSVQSSGTLELLPMFNLVDQMACFQEHLYARMAAATISPIAEISDHNPLLYVEEPEAHVFPRTQYDLVKLFTWLAKDPILNFDWVITTHSPYILSAFSNLIFAGHLGQDKKLTKKIKIEEKYWIKPGLFRAYSVHDGKAEPILSDSGLINGEYLDSVSETIGSEFDELLRLEYGKKKAA